MEDKTLKIMAMHHAGMACPRIANALGMPTGIVRRHIVEEWARDKERAVANRQMNARINANKKHKARVAKVEREKQTRRFPDDLVRAIRAQNGVESASKCAIRFGVSSSSVYRIWLGETYREVE